MRLKVMLTFALGGAFIGASDAMLFYKLHQYQVPLGELISFMAFAFILYGISLGLFGWILCLIFKLKLKNRWTRYGPIILTGLTFFFISLVPAHRFPKNVKELAGEGLPNILLITLDTTSAKHLSLYGYERKTTPNLEKLAEKGVVFEQAISVSPWTLASHSSIFTGKFPSEHGATYRSKKLCGDNSTLAELLSDKGYRTAAFVSGPYLRSEFGISQGFQYYDDQLHSLKGYLFLVRGIDKIISVLSGERTVNYLKNIISYIESRQLIAAKRPSENANQRVKCYLERFSGDNPFFIFINYFDPHEPYMIDAPFDTMFTVKDYDDPSGELDELLRDHLKARLTYYSGKKPPQGFWEYELKIQELANSIYDGLIRYMDEQLADLIDFMDSRGDLENTYIIVIADHGESLGERRVWGHNNLYDEVVNVPLIIIGPNIPQGLRVKEQVTTKRIFDTVLDLSHDSTDRYYEGSLCNLWNDEYFAFDYQVYGQYFRDKYMVELYGEKYDRDSFMSRISEQKLIYRTSGDYIKYNLIDDPDEINNLYRNREISNIDTLFNDFILKSLEEMKDVKEYEIPAGAVEQLKAVGYIK